MHVVFLAALDAIAQDLARCPSRDWRGGMVQATQAAGAGRSAFPMRAAEEALVAALADRDRGGAGGDAAPELSAVLDGFPVFAWQTPDAIELGFSTLSPVVRRHLVAGEEPGALARAGDGWRTPLALFRFADGLQSLRLTTRTRLPWRDFAGAREAALDALADLRTPLLARIAEIAGVFAAVLAERALPAALPSLTPRDFLAFRGHLEARTAAQPAPALATALRRLSPLFRGEHGLGAAEIDALDVALAGDWRGDLQRWVVPVERELAPALEHLLGLWLFAAPLHRDRTLQRGWAELFEGVAAGLRYAAAIGAAQQAPLGLEQAAAAFALGEHAVAWSDAPLPLYAPPPAGHDRGPRMADLDMTLESIC